jgi:exopolyphosphatase/guanosine-5'-triphosphate,3'-diphosphate pyrophosphatase
MRLAAIDIGSNAARLLITEVIAKDNGEAEFLKLNLVRVPLRLGFDVFESGTISQQRIGMIMQTMLAYKHLMDAYGVKNVIAAATSAMRDAANGKEIIRKVKQETGIDIEIISGDYEASLIYENHIAENMSREESYLYIDVGGGSTELTFFSDGKLVYKRSFNIGTIRILKNMVSDEIWDEMKEEVKTVTKGLKHINKVFSLSKRKEGKPLHIDTLRDYYKELNNFTLEERMYAYKLREDRADVIVPALLIYINVMRWADCTEIYVPKIGLADGLIHHLYEEIMEL